jgi:hypothetical protein
MGHLMIFLRISDGPLFLKASMAALQDEPSTRFMAGLPAADPVETIGDMRRHCGHNPRHVAPTFGRAARFYAS